MRPSDRPGRQPLDADDIRALDQALIAAYTMHAELRARYPVAGYISRPGIPAQLSESLVAVAAPVLFGEGARAEYGGIKADLRLRWPDGREWLVEVKATGGGEFQEVKPRDFARDALVWVAFSRRYEEGQGPIDIHVLRQPGRFALPRTKAGAVRTKFALATFLRGSSALEGYVGWRFDDIEQILSDQPIDRFLAQCADPRWWTQTIAFAAVHARAPGG